MDRFKQLVYQHPNYQKADGRLLCFELGGSHAYGLNTPTSDIDYRGVYRATDSLYKYGYHTPEPIVIQDSEADVVVQEARQFLKLLRKCNTQSLELVSAQGWFFDEVRAQLPKLLDLKAAYDSFTGYAHAEWRLATGESQTTNSRTLGKRATHVKTLGFSAKNLVNLYRILRSGEQFMRTGSYPVHMDAIGEEFKAEAGVHSSYPTFRAFLMALKTEPAQFSLEDLRQVYDSSLATLAQSYNDCKLEFKVDDKAVAYLLRELYE